MMMPPSNFVALCGIFILFTLNNVFGNEKGIDDESVFRALFKRKRSQQLRAVKDIVSLGEHEKQNKMVTALFEKMFEMFSKSKVALESSGYVPGTSFPKDENIREALSHTLENTAFLGDIVLRLPDITHKLFQKNKEWQVLAHWSVGFSNSTELFDDKTVKLINLVAQELNLIERDPSFINPYKIENKIETPASFSSKESLPVKKKKKKLKRGPQLSGARHEL